MAFVKGSLGDNQKVKEYTDGLEGRVDSAFKEVDGELKKISYIYTTTIKLPSATGWEAGQSYDVPSYMIPFSVISATVPNVNGSILQLGNSVRPNNGVTKLYAELTSDQSWAVGKTATVTIVKI